MLKMDNPSGKYVDEYLNCADHEFRPVVNHLVVLAKQRRYCLGIEASCNVVVLVVVEPTPLFFNNNNNY